MSARSERRFAATRVADLLCIEVVSDVAGEIQEFARLDLVEFTFFRVERVFWHNRRDANPTEGVLQIYELFEGCAVSSLEVESVLPNPRAAAFLKTAPILVRRRHSSVVEQLFRKQQVLGSNPSVGSTPTFVPMKSICRHPGRDLALVRGDGSVALNALDRLSIMARPPEAAGPGPGQLLPDEPQPMAWEKGEWLPHLKVIHPRMLWVLQRIADGQIDPRHSAGVTEGLLEAAGLDCERAGCVHHLHRTDRPSAENSSRYGEGRPGSLAPPARRAAADSTRRT